MRGWAVKHWRGGIYIETVRRTRSEAIRCFKEQFDIGDKHWVEDRRAGVHRAVRVAILPVQRIAA